MKPRKEGSVEVVTEPPLTVSCERTATTEHIRVQGEMDMSVTPILDREIRRAEAGDASRILLDLDELEFVDAAGIQLLLDLKARSDSHGGRLLMTRASSPHVRRMFQVTGVSELLPFAA